MYKPRDVVKGGKIFVVLDVVVLETMCSNWLLDVAVDLTEFWKDLKILFLAMTFLTNLKKILVIQIYVAKKHLFYCNKSTRFTPRTGKMIELSNFGLELRAPILTKFIGEVAFVLKRKDFFIF